MINLTTKQSIISATRADKRLFKKSLKERSIKNEWELAITKKHGSLNNYNAKQRAETDQFIREVLT